jgi:predicted Zn-dependent protease
VQDKDILGEIQRNLVDNPLIERLGLSEEHFAPIYDRAMERLAAGDIEAAFRDMANLVLLSPTSVQFQLGLAQVALRADLPELAMQAAAVIVAQAPDRPEGFLLSGQACLAMGEPGLAREDLADAIARAEGNPRYAALARMARQTLVLAGGA